MNVIPTTIVKFSMIIMIFSHDGFMLANLLVLLMSLILVFSNHYTQFIFKYLFTNHT